MQSLLRTARRSAPVETNVHRTRAPVRVRWCGWLLAAACSSDPSLGVTVHHPDGYAVVQTRVTVYSGGDVTCDEIQYGDRSDAELVALEVFAADVTGGGQIEVSRLGDKAITVRGYDAQQRFVTAGCQDVGEIAEATRVAITTQPTATVAIDPAQPDRPFHERTILVNMTDVHGAMLDGTVSWKLTGPAGTQPTTSSAGTPTRNGNLRLSIDDIGVPGPEGLRIRAPWATAPSPLVTGFDLSHARTIALGGGAAASRPACAVRGHAGKPPTLVCLSQANVQGHRDLVEIAWQGDSYGKTAIPIPGGVGGIDNQFAVFVDRDGSADEPVYVLANNPTGVNNWYKAGAATGSNATFAGSLQNVVYIPRCADGASTALVGVQTGTVLGLANQVQIFTPAGAPVGDPIAGELFSGGCVHDVDHLEHQAVVVAGANGDTAVALLAPGATAVTPIAAVRLTGSGFVTIASQGAVEKRFAGARLGATGTVVFEAVLAHQGSSYTLVERTEVEAAAPPDRIAAGRLDGDGDSDLMWNMAIGARRGIFQVSLAAQVRGAPLTAVTSGPVVASTSATPGDFLTADLNGRQIDEMVLYTQSAVTIYTPDE